MRYDKRLTRLLLSGSCLAGVMLVGCSSPPAPKDRLAVGQSAIEAAQTAGAGEMAPVELNQAREKFAKAQLAMQKQDYLVARRLADEAIADAQVARSKATAQRSIRAADEITAGLKTLRDQMNRSADSGLMPNPPAAGASNPNTGNQPPGMSPQDAPQKSDMPKQDR